MKEKLFSLIIFVFSAQLLLGQEKFTIRGEFPDNSLDGKYVLLIDKSYLLEEREGQKQARQQHKNKGDWQGIFLRRNCHTKAFFCTNIL